MAHPLGGGVRASAEAHCDRCQHSTYFHSVDKGCELCPCPSYLNSDVERVGMTHGGYREGSGRKPVLNGGVKRTFVLTLAHLALLDQWQAKHRLDNRSSALRNLIETAAKVR